MALTAVQMADLLLLSWAGRLVSVAEIAESRDTVLAEASRLAFGEQQRLFEISFMCGMERNEFRC